MKKSLIGFTFFVNCGIINVYAVKNFLRLKLYGTKEQYGGQKL